MHCVEEQRVLYDPYIGSRTTLCMNPHVRRLSVGWSVGLLIV